MEYLWFIIAGLTGFAWWQSRRIENLSRRLGELERRLGPPMAPAATPAPGFAEDDVLVLDQPLAADDDVLVLDTPVPEAVNDDINRVVAPAPSRITVAPEPATPAPVAVTEEDDEAPIPPIPEAARPAARAAASEQLPAISPLTTQTLGLAAIAALFLAPLFLNVTWDPDWLTLYVCAAGAVGFTLAAFQRWAWVAAATLWALYAWFAAAIGAEDVRRALALLSFASLGGVAIAFRPPLEDEPRGVLSWRTAHALSPAVAISISSVAMVWAWLAASPAESGLIAGPAWVAAMFVALAAVAVRSRLAPALAVLVATIMLAGGFLIYLGIRFPYAPGADFYTFILIAAAVVVTSAVFAQPHRRERALIAAAGGAGAAWLTALAALSRPEWHSLAAWMPLFAGAAILLGATWLTARDIAEPEASLAVDFWSGSAAALLLIGIESLFPDQIRTAGHASLALTLAAAFTWRRWRALRWAALVAATLSILHAISGPMIGLALAGEAPLWQGLLVLAIAASLLFCAGFIAARRAPFSSLAEALRLAGAIMVLAAAFAIVRWLAEGAIGAPFDPFIETALQVLLLLFAGHLLLARAGRDTGWVGAASGHLLLAAALVHAAMTLALLLNPWWGATPATLGGAPLAGPLLLAFGVPAALLLFAARRLYAHKRTAARIYAGAGAAFALLWLVLELRRAFHGAAMAETPVGVFEAACYPLLALIAALTVALAARARAPLGGPFGRDLGHIMRASAWAGLAIAALLMLGVRHPWWGAQVPEDSDALSIGLAAFAQAIVVVLALVLGRALSVARGRDPARFAAAAAAALFAWSFGHVLIRWLYHAGGADGGGAMNGLEGFAHALWPLAFVLAASAITERAPGRDTVRSYLYDLQAIWSAAVWPAVLFAGLGLWLMFNPWWGESPAPIASSFDAWLALALMAAAAWLSAMAAHVSHLRLRDLFTHTAHVAAIAHLFVAVTLAVRASFNGGAIFPGDAAPGPELWAYSAAWLAFGAAIVGVGLWRGDNIVRWCGFIILTAAAVKVFLFDMERASGALRVFLGLGAAAALSALAMWRLRANPGQQLLRTISTAPRETPHGPP